MRRLHPFRHRLVLAMLIVALGVLPLAAAPVAAKEGFAPSWIASGSQPLPPGCTPMDAMFGLQGLFQEYNGGNTLALQMRRETLGSSQHPIVIPGHLNHVAVMTDARQLAEFAATRHAQHDRFVLLQVVVSQGNHPWLDVTFDAFREADDFPGRVVGGTAQFDCTTKSLLGMNVGNDELIAALQPPAIAVPANPPTATACTVAPVPDPTLPDLTRQIRTAKWLWATTYGPSTAETRLVPDDYPAIPGLIATTKQLLACVQAREFGRAAALFTPNYFAHAPQATEMPELAIPRLLLWLVTPSTSPKPALDSALHDMDGPQLLPDGRVAVWLTITGTAMATNQQVVFTKVGDRWLIDGAYLSA